MSRPLPLAVSSFPSQSDHTVPAPRRGRPPVSRPRDAPPSSPSRPCLDAGDGRRRRGGAWAWEVARGRALGGGVVLASGIWARWLMMTVRDEILPTDRYGPDRTAAFPFFPLVSLVCPFFTDDGRELVFFFLFSLALFSWRALVSEMTRSLTRGRRAHCFSHGACVLPDIRRDGVSRTDASSSERDRPLLPKQMLTLCSARPTK